MNTNTTVFNVEKYVKHLKYGQLFTFAQVMIKVGAEKDTVSHALKKLSESNKIISVKRGVYLRPKVSKFGNVLPAPGDIVKIIAKEKKAAVYPSGASLLNSFGISTQMSMGETYISSKRIQPFCVNNTKVYFNYSRAFENAEKKLTGLTIDEKELSLNLWIMLDYMGEKEALRATPKLQYHWSKMSDQGKCKFQNTLNGKLHWAKLIMAA